MPTPNVRVISMPAAAVAPTAPMPQRPVSSAPSTSSASSQGGTEPLDGPRQHYTDKKTVESLIKEIDPLVNIDDEVAEVLMDLCDEFIEQVSASSRIVFVQESLSPQVVDTATDVAAARGGTQLKSEDVNFVLERHFNMWLPGMGTDSLRALSAPQPTDTHNARMATIKKTLKKP